MRALAEYIMRGRAQAVLIAILFVPVVPQATIALITLHRGLLSGLTMVFWAVVPWLTVLWSQRDWLPLASLSLLVQVLVYVGAMLLRLTMSWVYVAFAISLVTAISSVLFLQVFGADLVFYVQELQKARLEQRGVAYDESLMVADPYHVFVRWMVPWFMYYSLAALVVGRWWQAQLFNPGGLRQEFYTMRLPAWLAAVLIVVTTGLMLTDYWYWSRISGLPLVLVSVAMAHQFAGTQRMGNAWVVVVDLALANWPF